MSEKEIKAMQISNQTNAGTGEGNNMSENPIIELLKTENVRISDRAEEKKQIKRIRGEIFRLIKDAPSLEVVHWYCWLDESFENDEFSSDEFDKVQWRIMALNNRQEPIGLLANLITPVLQRHGCVDEKGKAATNK